MNIRAKKQQNKNDVYKYFRWV